MKKQIFIMVAAILISYPAAAQTGNSGSMSCPPDYALSIDPPPPSTDDPVQPNAYVPQTAAQKQQAEDQARSSEISRWHCIPLASLQLKK